MGAGTELSPARAAAPNFPAEPIRLEFISPHAGQVAHTTYTSAPGDLTPRSGVCMLINKKKELFLLNKYLGQKLGDSWISRCLLVIPALGKLM